MGLSQLTLIETLPATDDLAEPAPQIALEAVVDKNTESQQVIEEGIAVTV